MASNSAVPVEGFGTGAVRSGLPHDQGTGALAENICLSTTFQQLRAGKPTGSYIYSRSRNLNRPATSAVLQGLAVNSHVLSIASLYGGTHRYFTRLGASLEITVTYTNAIELDAANLVQENTTLLWIETPSNPTLFLVEIEAVTKVAHEKGVLVDVLMGALAFNSQELEEKISFIRNAGGGVPSPFDCWLAHRGIKTLHLRAAACSTSALTISRFLQSSKHVLSVNYPGLFSHPHHHIALKQHRKGLHGGVISFRIKGGMNVALKFCETSRYFTLAESLGGIESLCEVPAVMTHNGMRKEVRENSGVFDDMIRVSVGIEDVGDLVRDLEETLEKVAAS
ncbi:hypothetical protein K458DRAFT_481682 [Lentithecium fluviatile CBS 122367]|uniref:cystathionine gamma-lyase n=1 Tax=Lentithecium fluviatile CBS 122367 TaxID=1168545 RepID=A0A6G1IF53_9PLEO|nr:hypothetical protein K458DRAFT_481682 [Lentithecium fluviatile CBS 122367]